MSDRADEIAREIDDWLLDHAARPARQHKIAAALRSYGDERLEECAGFAERFSQGQAIEISGEQYPLGSLARDSVASQKLTAITLAVLFRSLKSKPEIQEGKA